jgi:hypothetical protein
MNEWIARRQKCKKSWEGLASVDGPYEIPLLLGSE